MQVGPDSRVVGFAEKPADPSPIPGKPGRALASMGIYVFNASFLYEQLIRDADEPRSSHDFGKDIIPYLVPRYRVFANSFADSCVGQPDVAPYWRDVGTLDSYWEANMELIRVTPDLNMYDKEWPIWTYQEQLPPAKFVFDDDDRRGSAVDSLVSGGCIVSGATLRRSLLFSDVRIESHSTIEDSVILPNVTVGSNVKLRRAIVDRRCQLPDGMVAGYDPAHDRERFYVTEKGIVLITPEMLGQRVHMAR